MTDEPTDPTSYGGSEPQPREDDDRSQSSGDDVEWLMAPDVPPGALVQISRVIEADELTPEVVQVLSGAMNELQQRAAARPKPTGCPRLVNCGVNSGPCPRLRSCGERSETRPPEPLPTRPT